MRIEDIDLASPDFFVDHFPHEAFATLRSLDPVHWQAERPPNSGFWAVTRFKDIETVMAEPSIYSSAMRGVILEEMQPDELEARRSMMERDPPDHTRLRRIVSPLFSPRAVREYETYCRQVARQVLDKALPALEFDFVELVSQELPIRVLVRILGVPDEDCDQLIAWGDQMIGNQDPEYATLLVDRDDTSEYRLLPFRSPAAAELVAYGHRIGDLRRDEPQDDLISKLVHAEVEGNRLSRRDFDNFFSLLVVAGNETTRHAISFGLKALIEHPDQLDKLRANPELFPSAVEEILRWASPTMQFRRTATTDTKLHGRPIREGDKVVVWFASANFDEDVFPDPFVFDVERNPNPQMAFGSGGPHFCLGAHLARLELRVMFEELVPRIREVEITGPIARLRSNFINGIKHMPVRVALN
jgi:cytochrome P450